MDILVVDDNRAFSKTLVRMLERQHYVAEVVHTATDCLKRLERAPYPSVILLDVGLPDMSGVEMLPAIRKRTDAAVIMVSGAGTVSVAVESLKLGAVDFIEKTMVADRLHVCVRNAMRMKRLETANAELLRNKPETGTQLVGESRAMRDLRGRIARIAPTESRVLILGENGTGKELVARSIHEQSRRSQGPFIAMNCAAIPSELIEAELFGHEAGAFTGAQRSRRGRFERAHQGTLFLDEIGDMPVQMQSKLLRVLQENTVERVGSSDTRTVSVRVLAATNQDLKLLISQGKFREDLYYRLAVIPLRTPPLREREGDVRVLVDYFRHRTAEFSGLERVAFTDEAIALLESYSYPGNIRELQNIVERLTVLAERNIVDARQVCSEVPALSLDAVTETSATSMEGRSEEESILQALSIAEGHKADAARILGISRSTLWRKMKQYGLDT